MLDKSKTAKFAEMVWATAATIGHSATRITDEIIGTAFPRTVFEAEQEGADRMLRQGVIIETKRILTRGGVDDDNQIDMAAVDPSFVSIARRLKKQEYFVESVDEYVPVAELIANLELLDGARKLMRRKGQECFDEAQVLDELYEAVKAAGEQQG